MIVVKHSIKTQNGYGNRSFQNVLKNRTFKFAGLWVWLGLLAWTARAQEFSDLFADRQLVTGASVVVTGSNTNATVEPGEPLHAGKIGGHSVWISWQAPENGVLTASTAGSTFDTLLGLYTLHSGSSSLQRLQEVSADDDEGQSFTSQFTVGVNSNRIYQIAVDGFDGAVGNIILNLHFLSSSNLQPTVLQRPGDQALRLGDPLILSIGITRVPGMDLTWYLNGSPITDDSAGPTLVIPSLQRTNLGFYSVRLELNDDNFFSTPVEIQVNSEGQSDVLARYKAADAAVSGLQPHAGGGVALGYNGTQIFNTTNSIADPNAPAICGATGGAPYWYSYQAPTNGIMTLDTAGSSFATLLGVFTYDGVLSSYTNLIQVACDATNGPNGLPSQVQFPAENGRKYLVVVDGVNGARGIAHLNYSITPGLPAVPPVISTPPQSLTVADQTTVALQVMADGTAPLTYQWLLNGAALKNETNASLLLTRPRSKNQGDYSVVVTNVAGAVTSAPANIQIIATPLTMVDPASNVMIMAFPATRGYQYAADSLIGGLQTGWTPWTNVLPDYGGIIWLTNAIHYDRSWFLRVHSP